MVSSEISRFPFDAALLMRFRRRAELTFKSPMRTESNKTSCFLAAIPPKDLLYRSRQIVIAKLAKCPAEEGERQLMRFQKRLLSRVGEGAVERRATGHASHREYL